MPRGALPGQRRGGRDKGTPNKRPKKVSQALVKLDQAEAEVHTILDEGEPISKLGKDRLAEIDEWAYSLAKLFAPEKDKEGRPHWKSPGDEARFER